MYSSVLVGAGKCKFGDLATDIKQHTATTMPPPVRDEMTVVERGIIVILCHLHFAIEVISKISGHPCSTTKNFLNQPTVRAYIEYAPKSGRPRRLSKQDRRVILRCVKNK